ncbi:MAG: nicotinamide riboside transporter PnuC [Opitutales bacterium]
MLETFLQQLAATSWVEWLGMATGIMGVWLSIKEKVAAWPLFIVCYCSYVYISFDFGLHAFMGLNVVFIGISIYGWLKWKRMIGGEQSELPITRTANAHWPWLGLFIAVATASTGWLLARNGEANLPYLDAFAASCGFAAQWLLSRKQIETWVFWIITDIIYLGIFIRGQSWPSVILFAAFIGLAIKGWLEWQNSVGKSA